MSKGRDKYSSEIQFSFSDLEGVDVRFDSSARNSIPPFQDGRADCVVLNNQSKNFIYIEHKYGRERIRKDQIKENQREFLLERPKTSFLSLTFGVRPDKRKKYNKNPRITFIIPYEEYIKIEQKHPKASFNYKEALDKFSKYLYNWDEDRGRIVILDLKKLRL